MSPSAARKILCASALEKRGRVRGVFAGRERRRYTFAYADDDICIPGCGNFSRDFFVGRRTGINKVFFLME